VIEGCVGLGVVFVAILLYAALRGALRHQNRALSVGPDDHPFSRKENLKRPFFLSRSGDPEHRR
jgi:hypothetical protein